MENRKNERNNMDITLTAESIEDILPVDRRHISIELSGVDLEELIKDITVEALLDEIGTNAIQEYLKSVDQDENGDVVDKSAGWHIGTRVQHNFSNEIGTIIEHRDDPQGYDWFVHFDKSKTGEIYEDWFKDAVLDEL